MANHILNTEYIITCFVKHVHGKVKKMDDKGCRKFQNLTFKTQIVLEKQQYGFEKLPNTTAFQDI